MKAYMGKTSESDSCYDVVSLVKVNLEVIVDPFIGDLKIVHSQLITAKSNYLHSYLDFSLLIKPIQLVFIPL